MWFRVHLASLLLGGVSLGHSAVTTLSGVPRDGIEWYASIWQTSSTPRIRTSRTSLVPVAGKGSTEDLLEKVQQFLGFTCDVNYLQPENVPDRPESPIEDWTEVLVWGTQENHAVLCW